MADDLRSAAPGADAVARRRANVRLALILASVALIFFLGFIVRIALYGAH